MVYLWYGVRVSCVGDGCEGFFCWICWSCFWFWKFWVVCFVDCWGWWGGWRLCKIEVGLFFVKVLIVEDMFVFGGFYDELGEVGVVYEVGEGVWSLIS